MIPHFRNFRESYLDPLLALFQIYLASFYKYWFLHSSVQLVNSRTARLDYMLNGRRYTAFFAIKRGPSKIRRIRNESWGDITEEMKQFLGPNENFHGYEYMTPKLMGYEELHFDFTDGTERFFTTHEIIKL